MGAEPAEEQADDAVEPEAVEPRAAAGPSRGGSGPAPGGLPRPVGGGRPGDTRGQEGTAHPSTKLQC